MKIWSVIFSPIKRNGVNKALRQASILIDITLEDERCDIDNGVHNVALMFINDIKSVVPHIVTTINPSPTEKV